MYWLRRSSVPALLLTLSFAGLAACEPAPPAAEPSPAEEKWLLDRTLTLTPQPEPRAALAYRLFPLASERKDGNAVPIYLRLNHEQNDAARRDWSQTPDKWNEAPVDKIPLKDAKAFLTHYARFLRQLELGSRRKTADWDYTLDEGDGVINILLPDAQMMRGYVPMLLLKARVELADGDFAAAAHWFETGFAFSRHVSDGPFLINRLVGVAGASQFADGLLDFVERPDAPNLYWSLVNLPRPLIDMRDSLDLEYLFLTMQFPDLTDLDRPRSPEQWDAVLKKVRTEYRLIVGLDNESGADGRLKPIANTGPDDPAAKSPDLPTARKYLTEQKKLAVDKVEAMAPAQVLLLYLVDSYNEFRDDTYKAAYLPYPEARSALAAADARLKAAPETEAQRFAYALLPAIAKVKSAEARLDRKIAALRVIEALRLHAAAHDGALPDKLSDVTAVPIPDDPGTGKPFEYRRDGDGATLISRIPGEKPEATAAAVSVDDEEKPRRQMNASEADEGRSRDRPSSRDHYPQHPPITSVSRMSRPPWKHVSRE